MKKYTTTASVIFHDGAFVKPEQANLHLYGQTLHYGNGVFEGIRAYKTASGAKIFKAKEHFERLQYGAQVMGIPFQYSVEELTNHTYELLKQNHLEDAYIRPLISAGADMSLQTSKESYLTIKCWAWGKYMGNRLLRVKTSKYQRPNPKSCVVDAKVTGHYVNSILATNDAKSTGYDESLLLDMNGFVAESSGANIFMEKNGKLFTPRKGSIMPGITRTVIMAICAEENIPVQETDFTLETLKHGDSAFFTGTAAEVVGLKSLDSYQFPMVWEDSLGFKLMKLYQKEVRGERIQKLSKAV